GNRNDRDGVDQRRFHGGLQLDRLFHVGGQALQDGIENTAGFARLNHVGGEVVKDLGILPHRVGKRGSAFNAGANAGEAFLENLVFLVGGQNLQTLHQGKSGIDHHGELPEEHGQVLDGDFAGTQLGQGEFFALLLDGARGNALAAQL